MGRKKRVGYMMRLSCSFQFDCYVSAEDVVDLGDDAPFVADEVLERLEADITKCVSRKYPLHNICIIDDGLDACMLYAVTEDGKHIKGERSLRERIKMDLSPDREEREKRRKAGRAARSPAKPKTAAASRSRKKRG